MKSSVGKHAAAPELTSRQSCMAFAIFSFVTLIIAGILWNPHLFQNRTPGQHKDDIFYDNLAFNLSQGEGYRLDFGNSEWRQPYRDPASGTVTNPVVNLQVVGETATRAPGYPYFLAAVYDFFGRRWDAVYLLQWIIVCSALTTLTTTVCRMFGFMTAMFATLTIACDFGVMNTIGQVMSEALATALASIAFCWLVFSWNQSRRVDANENKTFENEDFEFQYKTWRWLLLGVLFGLLVLFRANCMVWLLLLIALSIPWVIVLFAIGRDPTRLVLSGVLFTAAVIVVCFPWGYRNCKVVGRFQPLGPTGNIGWVGGYCDATYKNRGIWDLDTVVATQRELLNTLPIRGEKLAVQEYYMGQLSREKGNQWALENWRKLPRLMRDKALNHFALINRPNAIVPWLNAILLAAAAIGCLVSWRRFGFWVVLILFLSTTTTMLTWPHHGRYLVPMRPLIHCAAAIGVVYFWRCVLPASKQSEFNDA